MKGMVPVKAGKCGETGIQRDKRRWMEFSPPATATSLDVELLDVELMEDPTMRESHGVGNFSPPATLRWSAEKTPSDGIHIPPAL